jgi:ubiquinone/menaquinone biosynthesis C-methylase UbiE
MAIKSLRDGSSFKSWAPWFDDSALQPLLFEPTHQSVLHQLRLHAPGGGRMLDVGCGTGRLLQSAVQRYSLLVGVDPCVEMLESARARAASDVGHQPRFVGGRAEGLPFADETFEVVTSTLSLRHWDDPTRGMRELVRVLSPTGTLVIADAELESRPVLRRRWRIRRPVGQLRLLVARSGLEVVGVQEPLVRGPVPRVQVLTARHRR